MDLDDLCNTLSMTEIIRLQCMLSSALAKRFERHMALAFSDIVGSTPYFSRFGNEAGRQLQQRHVDLLSASIAGSSGRIVDTAGDGAFLCFEVLDQAVSSMVDFLRRISLDNAAYAREHQLAVRIGIHCGSVLTDGAYVTGDPVNFCARVASSAGPGEVRLSKEAFFSLTDLQFRLKCRMLSPVSVKGIEKPVDLLTLDWRDRAIYPTRVRLESGEEYSLPDQDVISFGRLDKKDGFPANDIVLQCGDENQTLQISRWHFELRRRPDGVVLRAVSNAPLNLNDRPLVKGEECAVRSGDCVRVGNVLSLQFLSPQEVETKAGSSETIIAPAAKAT